MGTCSTLPCCRRVAVCTAVLAIVVLPAAAQEMAADVLRLVNEQRVSNGLEPLTRAVELEKAAVQHSTDMATRGFFSHVTPEGTGTADRITAVGYRWTTWAENIAAGYSTPQSAVAAWMKSPGHRANILNPNLKETGVGVVYRPGSRYGYYWTQTFGARSGTRPNPPPQATVVADPVLDSVLPATGEAGVTITLSGSNFGATPGASRVMIRNENDGSTFASSEIRVENWTDTRVTITLLAGDPGRSTTDQYHLWVRRDTGGGRYRASNALTFTMPTAQ